MPNRVIVGTEKNADVRTKTVFINEISGGNIDVVVKAIGSDPDIIFKGFEVKPRHND